MEIRNLITFLKVAELSNFTHAAEQLGYVQSTVTMQVQQLEAELGCPLFDRIGKRIALTPMGKALIPRANQIIQLSEQALALGKSAADIRGTLRIGTVESLAAWEVSGLIPQYHLQFPNVAIEMTIASGVELMALLSKNELDLIFILDQNLSAHNFVRAFAHPEKLVFVTTPQNPLCHKSLITLRDIVSYPLVLPERHGIYCKALENVTLQQGLELSPVIQANDTSLIIKLLQYNLGISFLPEYAIQHSVEKGKLAILETADCQIEFWSQLFYHKNKWVTLPMQGFMDLLESHYREK